jgi:protocatechuate 3,4-dioxygenase, beta subunit
MCSKPGVNAMPTFTHVSALSRRAASVALIAAPYLWLGSRAHSQVQAQAARQLTPSQTEGPFYPVRLPKDSDYDLLRNGTLDYAAGQAVWVQGNVTDTDGKPVVGAQVEIWQADQAGHYDHPGDGGRADPAFQGFGRVAAGTDGSYRFRTIRPVPYTGRAPHIHFKVKLGSRELLTTQLYVEGDPGNARDGIWRRMGEADRAAVTAAFKPGSDGLMAQFPIVVRA